MHCAVANWTSLDTVVYEPLAFYQSGWGDFRVGKLESGRELLSKWDGAGVSTQYGRHSGSDRYFLCPL